MTKRKSLHIADCDLIRVTVGGRPVCSNDLGIGVCSKLSYYVVLDIKRKIRIKRNFYPCACVHHSNF